MQPRSESSRSGAFSAMRMTGIFFWGLDRGCVVAIALYVIPAKAGMTNKVFQIVYKIYRLRSSSFTISCIFSRTIFASMMTFFSVISGASNET